jgi:hypothetical protein
MTRWSYEDPPSWVWTEECRRDPAGWVGVDTGEIYVCINNLLEKVDAKQDNIEWEDGIDLIFEDDNLGPNLFLLE